MIRKNFTFWRIFVLVLAAIVTVFAYLNVNRTYDPLSRYPYTTSATRAKILEYLDDDEIEYIIDRQIKPSTFIPFIQENGFNIKNSPFYSIAYKTRKASKQEIVDFINRYRKYFTQDSLSKMLKAYSYEDLTNFFETQLLLNDEQELVSEPGDPNLVLSSEATVFKYIPNDLTDFEGKKVKGEMVEDLQEMLDDMNAFVERGTDKNLDYGYESYEDILNRYLQLSKTFKDETNQIYLNGGHNENQLGFTITLLEQNAWLDLLDQHPEALSRYNYEKLKDDLSEDLKKEIDWLESNSWKYGFVLRYPEGKENKTDHVWQPFVLRYVGKEQAEIMHDEKLIMEDIETDE